MVIQVSSGAGTGPTKLAAFDAALRDAGVANYNLIKLSSVIPAAAEVKVTKKPKLPGQWGDRLYVVLAEDRQITPNVESWAGIGWAQDTKTGQGLFVEHHGANEKSVRKDIEDSLKALFEGRRMRMGPVKMEVKGLICHHEAVCSVVLAVYDSTPWKNNGTKGLLQKLTGKG